MNIVWVLKTVAPREQDAYKACQIAIYSSKQIALHFFARGAEDISAGLDPVDDHWLNPDVLMEELATDGFTEFFAGAYYVTLTELMIDSGDLI